MSKTGNSEISFNNLPEAVSLLLQKIDALECSIHELKENTRNYEPEELLTRQETADYLKCDLSTIHHWTKKGKIIKHCIGNRAYYKMSELTEAMRQIR
jgi:hypothetical protein